MTNPDNGNGVRVADLAAWAIRTYVPIAVVAALGWAAAHWHIVLGDKTSTTVTVGAVAAGLAVYVGAARWLERRAGDGRVAGLTRWLGRWMLGGVLRQPVYTRPDEHVRVVTATAHTRPPG
jgi:hypothetical protein